VDPPATWMPYFGSALDGHPVPVGVEFLSDDHRQGGTNPLSHLRIWREDQDGAVGLYLHIVVDCYLAHLGGGFCA
jgi:hypothetical protein